jgi:hypothetical protein
LLLGSVAADDLGDLVDAALGVPVQPISSEDMGVKRIELQPCLAGKAGEPSAGPRIDTDHPPLWYFGVRPADPLGQLLVSAVDHQAREVRV